MHSCIPGRTSQSKNLLLSFLLLFGLELGDYFLFVDFICKTTCLLSCMEVLGFGQRKKWFLAGTYWETRKQHFPCVSDPWQEQVAHSEKQHVLSVPTLRRTCELYFAVWDKHCFLGSAQQALFWDKILRLFVKFTATRRIWLWKEWGAAVGSCCSLLDFSVEVCL